MTIATWLRFLRGERAAIEQLSVDRRTLLIGAVFVLSAGLAREYDQEYLVAQPWFLLIPFAASLPASLAVFTVVRAFTTNLRRSRPRFGAGYLAFLGLFWMTAPLAWLYAIPVERILSPLAATQVNLCLLAIVSVWRVLLIMRLAVVLTGCSGVAAWFYVMLMADVITICGLIFSPTPLPAVMGGARLSAQDALIANVVFMACGAALFSLPVWLVGALMVRWKQGRTADARSTAAAVEPLMPATTVSAGLKWLCILSILVWLPLLPFTQREQRLRYAVESKMAAGEVAAALDVLNANLPTDFPPHWTPPPRGTNDRDAEALIDVMDEISEQPVSPWVRDLYVERLAELSCSFHFWHKRTDVARLRSVLQRLPAGPQIAAGARQFIANELEYVADVESLRRTQLEALLKLADQARR